MPLLLVADNQTELHWWFRFVNEWGNSASVVSFGITLIGFVVTWIIQAQIRREVRSGLLRVAKQMIAQSLSQLQLQLTMMQEHVAAHAWQRAYDCCGNAREISLRTLSNPHLSSVEKGEMRGHADNLTQIRDYIRITKFVPDPPADFQEKKSDALETMLTFVITLQTRLEAPTWES